MVVAVEKRVCGRLPRMVEKGCTSSQGEIYTKDPAVLKKRTDNSRIMKLSGRRRWWCYIYDISKVHVGCGGDDVPCVIGTGAVLMRFNMHDVITSH